ncbi:MAG: hypothetical protein ACW99X_17400 [Candidatus Thorarchaeota archaeon]|jgi:hypothetical protein
MEPREHEYDETCWCNPTLYRTLANGTQIFIHHCETGETPPAEVMAEAIVRGAFQDDNTLNIVEDVDEYP